MLEAPGHGLSKAAQTNQMNPDLPPEVLFLCDRCKQPVMESDSWYTTNTIELCGECAHLEARIVTGIVRQIVFGHWQPMETAPKTDRILLCIGGEDWAIGSWNKDAFDGPLWEDDGLEPMAFIVQPTHWMPLPYLPPWPNDKLSDGGPKTL